jgi:hypothetical protein
MAVRFGLAGLVLAAAFWTIWYLAVGEVPTVGNVSRWWDIGHFPLWLAATVLLLTSAPITGKSFEFREFDGARLIGIMLGLVIGLFFTIAGLYGNQEALRGTVTTAMLLAGIFGLLAGLITQPLEALKCSFATAVSGGVVMLIIISGILGCSECFLFGLLIGTMAAGFLCAYIFVCMAAIAVAVIAIRRFFNLGPVVTLKNWLICQKGDK